MGPRLNRQDEEIHGLRWLVRDLEKRLSGLLGREGTKLQRHRVASIEPTSAQVLTWNDTTEQWEPTAPGAPSSHVLATTAGLGASHTTSGLTAGQVLRATGATTAAFQIGAVGTHCSWRSQFACPRHYSGAGRVPHNFRADSGPGAAGYRGHHCRVSDRSSGNPLLLALPVRMSSPLQRGWARPTQLPG